MAESLGKCVELCEQIANTSVPYLLSNLASLLSVYQNPLTDVYEFLSENQNEVKR